MKKPANIEKIEWKRLKKLICYEMEAESKGFTLIAGVDEAGRGPLAGPVVAAACYIPSNIYLPGIDDSKKLTELQREKLFETIVGDSRIIYGVGIIDSQTIDEINIYQATIKAMQMAVDKMAIKPDCLLVDGLKLPYPDVYVEKIISGDSLSQSIAAASVIAKVTRDKLMVEFHMQWPHYGFDRHKGYGTDRHTDALREHGPCPIHRKTFEPIKSMLGCC